MYALLAMACAVVVVVTAVRATRCAKAASIVEDARHDVPAQVEAAADRTTGEIPDEPLPTAPDHDAGQTCTSSYCTIPSHGHAPSFDTAIPDQLPATDDAPPARPPTTLERPPRT